MSYEHTKVVSKQNVEGPPIMVIQKGRGLSSDISHTRPVNHLSADPPGLPTSSYLQNSDSTEQSDFPPSVQLVDEYEQIIFDDCEGFASVLGCPMDRPVKVVSIVGNTGDGKSYTLNHTFFNAKDVFRTSPSQTTCTIGVWAAYSASMDCIVLDTEGMLGTSLNQNQHRRLLLKVFAISDIVIYLTKAPRLHTDMFTFLADASDSFAQHFRPDLEALAKRTGLPWTAGQLGPAVIVFQETRHTDPLDDVKKPVRVSPTDVRTAPEIPTHPSQYRSGSISQILQTRLAGLKRNVDSFSSLDYIGTQTKDGPTDFKPLTSLVSTILKDTSVRAPRNLEHIFSGLHLLNTRFTNSIPSSGQYTFVEEYFTCPVTCDSCSVRCCLSVGHADPHQALPSSESDSGKQTVVGCRYDSVLKNKLYYCKDCYALGIKTMVVPKSGDSFFDAARYLCSGYVLECKRHGVIYQSRSLWAGNAEPEETARVHWEVVHVWSGEKTVLQGVHPFSQILLDGMNAVTKQMSDLAGPPVRLLGDLFADSLAPDYWQPNSTIRYCSICKFEFPDPSADCVDYDSRAKGNVLPIEPAGERCHTDQGAIGKKQDQPMRGTALLPRTSSITPLSDDGDEPAQLCLTTKISPITSKLILDTDKHHCRACGRGVCGACSMGRLHVPGFGSEPVRVCNECHSKRSGKVYPTNTDTVVQQNQVLVDGANSNVYTGRRALEMYSATVNSVPPVFSMVKDTFKSLARPAYWTPDHLCKCCAICNRLFGPSRRIHHCRSCGRGVCEPCSPHRQPVPLRGLDLPHRVCNECFRSST